MSNRRDQKPAAHPETAAERKACMAAHVQRINRLCEMMLTFRESFGPDGEPLPGIDAAVAPQVAALFAALDDVLARGHALAATLPAYQRLPRYGS